MNYIVIEKSDFTKKRLFKCVNSYLHTYLKDADTIIFDIHNTIEFDNDIDKNILNFIKKNKKLNIILLSYDGNEKRIIHNNNKLDKHTKIFKTIPKIFIKKRKKHYVIGMIYKILQRKYKSRKRILFVDDNYKNITDAKRVIHQIPNFRIIHYTAHTLRKSDEGYDDITEILQEFSSVSKK
jgi:hypothetical protein